MIFLTDAERVQLRTQHRKERDGRVRDRIKAVLLCDKGWSIAAIAEFELPLPKERRFLTHRLW